MQAEYSYKTVSSAVSEKSKTAAADSAENSLPKKEENNRTITLKKLFKNRIISISGTICSGVILFNYFTLGTAVYTGNRLVAFSADEGDYYEALSTAKNYANDNRLKINDGFILVPSLVLKSKASSGNELTDKLLLTSPSFSSGCTLYSGDKKIFTAPNEATAKKVVKEYVSEFSMDGKTDVTSELTYKNTVIPKKDISGEEKCGELLRASGSIDVVSVVKTSVKKEIPFETMQQQDPQMYIGEIVTLTEGKTGTTEIESQTVYKNGEEESNRVVSEKVIYEPVTAVVKVGTKPRNVLDSGLFYPLTGTRSSDFGERWGRMHEGIDIAVNTGTPVKAAECGVVTFAGEAGGYGNFVKIDHGNGVVTAYAHLSTIEVKEGQNVTADTQIALSGNTGRSTGPHLHFEVLKNGTPLNPDLYLKER